MSMFVAFVDDIRTGGTANVLQHMIPVQSQPEFKTRAQKRNCPQWKQIHFFTT